jgi:peptidoglycan/LPS O-acetylase OafA/YrhL
LGLASVLRTPHFENPGKEDMMEPQSANRIFGLDVMRAAAIVMVLIGHCAWIFPGSGVYTAILSLLSFMGVEIFFVLSGFLIGRILYRQFMAGFDFASVKKFLRRRWFRTLPNYFLILLVNIGVALLVGSPANGLWRYFLFLQNFASPLGPFFTESWSLSIEEFAYVVLPLSMLLGFSLSKPRNKSLFFLTVILALIAVFIGAKLYYHFKLSRADIDYWNLALKSVVVYRLDAIFIGVLAGWICDNFPVSWSRMRYAGLSAGFAMTLFFTFGVGWLGLFIETHPFFWNVVYLPLASVSVALFLPMLSRWRSASRAFVKPVTFISLVSYSIYLLHYSIVLQIMQNFVDTGALSLSLRLFFTACYLAITVLLSYFLYRFYEKPMTDRREA